MLLLAPFGRSAAITLEQKKTHGLVFAYKMKVNNTRPVSHLLIKILISFWPLSSIHLFQSNQRFQAIEFVDRHVSEKL